MRCTSASAIPTTNVVCGNTAGSVLFDDPVVQTVAVSRARRPFPVVKSALRKRHTSLTRLASSDDTFRFVQTRCIAVASYARNPHISIAVFGILFKHRFSSENKPPPLFERHKSVRRSRRTSKLIFDFRAIRLQHEHVRVAMRTCVRFSSVIVRTMFVTYTISDGSRLRGVARVTHI